MLRRPRLSATGALAVALIFAAPLAAQSGKLRIPPPPQPTPAPVEQPAEQEAAPAAATPSFWDAPSNAAEQVFAGFEAAQSVAASERASALERLRALGLETRVTALKALGSDWGPTVLLAAELLEWVGFTASEDPADVQALVEAASRTGMVEASGGCLDAALRLNGGALPARATSLLAHPNRSVRVVAEGRLGKAADPSHADRLLQLLEFGRDADVRLRAARLLTFHAAMPETRLALRRSLRDESAEVAFSAAGTLAGEARGDQVAFLVSELRQRCAGPEAGYLAYALLLQQQSHDATLIPDDVLPRLEALLEDADLFASAAAGACLAEFAYRSGPPATPVLWSRQVPFVLVRALTGSVFYPQFARFSPLAEDALERISGEEQGERGGWAAWLAQLGPEGLAFLRGRLEWTEADAARLRIAWRRGDAAAGELALTGAEAWLLPGERMLGARGLAELREELERSGLLEPVAASNRFGQEGEPVQAVVEITVGAQRKRLTFRGAAARTVEPLLVRCEAAWEAAAWQMLGAGDPDARAFVLEHLAAMEGADADARARAMIALTRGRAVVLDDATLFAWCERLLATPGLAPHWDAELAGELMAAVPARAADESCALALAGAALLGADAAMAGPMAGVAAQVGEPLRTRLLTLGMQRLGLDAARLFAADADLGVRVAALSALPALGADAAELLRAALAGPELPVRLAAIRGLGELGDAAALEEVAAFAAAGQPHELRKEAVWALGRFGEPRALPYLLEATASEQPVLRIAALLAIAAIPGDEAQLALGALFPDYAGTALESSYLRALLECGAAGARRALQPFYVHADAVLVRRSSLLGGLLGDPAAASGLMDWLPSDPRNGELLEALANTLCVDFRSLPDPAGTYLAWWRDHSAESPAAWFASAAEASGFRLPPEFAAGGQARVSVAELLRLLESGPAHLRAAATYFLHGYTGVDGSVVLAGTPADEVARRAAPWRSWLDG